MEGVSADFVGRGVDARGAHDVLLGQGWLAGTDNRAKFRDKMYTLGKGRCLFVRRDISWKCGPVLPSPEDASSNCTEISIIDDGQAADGLQGLLAQVVSESDSGTLDEEDSPAPTRLASLPRIMDDVDITLLEAIHVGPTISSPVVKAIRELLVEHKDYFAVSFADLERPPEMKFRIRFKDGSTSLNCGNQRRFSPQRVRSYERRD